MSTPAAVGPITLSIDIGGTGLKASVLDPKGAMLVERVKVDTTYPMPPERMVEQLVALVSKLPDYDRVSVGFPGMVRGGRILSAPKFNTVSGPDSAVDPRLDAAWKHFDLAASLSDRLGRPVRVANDADVQGAAVIQGAGLEMVVTLGTGVGTAVFMHGTLAPHLELAHQPFRKGETYDEQLGDHALKQAGKQRWLRRVAAAVANFEALLYFDQLYVGGGNARHVDPTALGLDRVSIVDNSAGILGGIRLWEFPIV